MKLRIGTAWLVLTLAALAAESGGELYQKAVTAERAGKMEDAIKLYEKVAHDFASDRPLAAKALVQAARDYEKLGQDKAVKLYEQVAREYGDQRELADAARAKLAALRQPAPARMTQRKIELAGVSDFLETDGQRVIYLDEAARAIMISDLAGNNKRVVFKPKQGAPLFYCSPSRDLSMAILTVPRDGGLTLAVTRTDGTGYREIARMEAPAQSFPTWSWDNRYLLYSLWKPDGTAPLIVVSIADGQIREVLRRKEAITAASFSPDGRFIAFAEGPNDSRKVLVVPAEGGDPQLISDGSSLLDWTRDGRYLAITSKQGGKTALSLLPMKDGRAAGAPVFISYGSYLSGYTFANGALWYLSIPPRPVGAISLGTLDADGHLSAWKRLNLAGDNPEPYPSWSPDGSQIVYTAGNDDAGQITYAIRLHEIASGKDRELYRSNGATMVCYWALHHPNLYCSRHADAGYTEILSISLESGRAEQLAYLRGLVLIQGNHDDSALYLGRMLMEAGKPNEAFLWNIATHAETPREGGSGLVSPDERLLFGTLLDPESGSRRIRIHPMSGGDWKDLVHLRIANPRSPAPSSISLTRDGNWIFYHDVDPGGGDGLYRISTSGGEPERLGDYPSKSPSGTLAISPDGRRIVAVAPEAIDLVAEAWLLENFEPKPPGK